MGLSRSVSQFHLYYGGPRGCTLPLYLATKPAEDEASKPVEDMTEEEQMEAYEESLKDTDWGHQPC